MEKQTVFVKVNVKDRMPSKKDTYLTDWGVCNFDPDIGKFSQNTVKFSQIMTQDGYGSYIVELKPTFWMEEIELPSEEDIRDNLLEQGSIANYALYQSGHEDGANFILNKLKGETKQWETQ